MTRPQIKRIVARWQTRLQLGDWEIEIDWDTPCDPDCHAQIAMNRDYKQARLRLDEPWRGWSPAHAERVLVHELCHPALAELVAVALGPVDRLGDEARELTKATLDRAEEHVVERFARSLFALAS